MNALMKLENCEQKSNIVYLDPKYMNVRKESPLTSDDYVRME